MSFCCFVPGQPLVYATSFTQVAPNRWFVQLESPQPIDEIAAFVTEPLAADTALGCHVASAPFEETSWHYLGAISNAAPRCYQQAPPCPCMLLPPPISPSPDALPLAASCSSRATSGPRATQCPLPFILGWSCSLLRSWRRTLLRRCQQRCLR